MKNYSIILLALFTFLSSCSSDKNSVKSDDLQGTWVCKKASDNGQDTDLIPGAEIKIKGSKLSFPLLENTNKSIDQEFTVKNDEIHCQKDKDLIFKIKDLKDKKMTLQFSFDGHELVLEMEKTKS